MKKDDAKPLEHTEVIEEQIQESLMELKRISEKQSFMKNANDLEAMEREINKVTDRLSGLILAKKIQQSVDSPELQEEVSELIKAHPKKLKNQGPREVEIRPARGGPITVKTSYFSQKGKKK